MKAGLIFLLIGISFSQLSIAQRSYTYLNKNYIQTGFFNDGISDIDVSESNSGLFYPKLSGKTTVFTSGFLWGAKITGDSIPHVGGSVYRTGLQPGRILNSGQPWNQLISSNERMYRVRYDVFPGGPYVDLMEESIIEGKSVQEIRMQYETDWIQWPAALGAPYKDVDGNGTYNSSVDIPGYSGAEQTIWYVANDLDPSLTTFMYGTLPLGIEVQVTIWNYLNFEPLNHVYFRQYKLINKSNTTFNSMYVSMWADPDVGNANDDFAGCDTTLDLGFAYNANNYDDVYEFTPPAFGIKLIKGPKVAANTTLNMTAFYYFARGDANVADPTQGDPLGAIQFYRFLQGKIGFTGQPFTNPFTGQPTSYAVNGDPINQTGWVDGYLLPQGDRRLGISSGPFNMAANDTQVVVVSEILAGGIDRINSFRLLKYYSELSTQLFKNGFIRSPQIPAPSIQVTQPSNSFLINWGIDTSLCNYIENFNQDGFQFQGYNVYQLSSNLAFKVNSQHIITFDKVDSITQIYGSVMNPQSGLPENGVLYSGSNSGIQRQFIVTRDSINGTYFIPGKKYYFGVSAYGYNPNPLITPRTIESFIRVVEVTFIDSTVWANYGNVLQVTQTAGIGEAEIKPTVVDPYQLTNHAYKIFFTGGFGDSLRWNLKDLATGMNILTNQSNFKGDYTSPIIHGLQLKIKVAFGFRNFSVVSNTAGPISPIHPGAFAFAGFPTPGNGNPISGIQQSTNNSRWGIHTADNGTRDSYEAFISRTTRAGTLWLGIVPDDYEIRFTSLGGWAYDAFGTGTLSFHVPFEIWNIGNNTPDNPIDDYRMVPWLWDDDLSGTFNMGAPGTKTVGTYDHTASTGEDDPYTDWIYWMRPQNISPGQAGYLSAESQMIAQTYTGGNESEVMARMVLVNWNGGTAPPYNANLPETGTIFRIQTIKSPTAGVDEFTFHNTLTLIEKEVLPTNYALFQNYPNPFNPTTKIQFSLAERGLVDLTVFNILGEKVQSLVNEEMDSGTHTILFNAGNLASGIYLYRIQVGSYVKTKKMILLR